MSIIPYLISYRIIIIHADKARPDSKVKSTLASEGGGSRQGKVVLLLARAGGGVTQGVPYVSMRRGGGGSLQSMLVSSDRSLFYHRQRCDTYQHKEILNVYILLR